MMSSKETGIIFNPRAGRGQAREIVERISVYFTAKGLKVRVRESERRYQEDDLNEYLRAIDSLIVVGGDGTIRPLLPRLSRLRVPVLLYPAGNESLVAKQFCVPGNVPDIFERICHLETEEHFFGFANDEPFFLMLGAGYDAEVVKRASLSRTWGSSDFLYFLAGMKSLYSYQIPHGKIYFDSFSGIDFCGPIQISNSSYYGRNLIPVAEANSGSKDFSVRVFNENKAETVFKWLSAVIFSKPLSISNSFISYPREVVVTFDNSRPVQIDGDFIGELSKISVRKSESGILFIV
ncbi:MAG TPA: diacylglycerol kinase family protein [Oligoflexia bacterium]|nr:diacylglycerol kinase family protein [Oligoflexia bacterium]HMP49299.1 diacylglycerol kinase family protein [Oligoflexia bacterium]